MARANEVSRVLAAAGHRRTSTSRTEVHGWTVHYRGFRCSNMSYGKVRVEHVIGSASNDVPEEHRRETRARFVARYRATLGQSYDVTEIENMSGQPVLIIRDKKEGS
jgi:hypothetical protein